jgi:hypothetical protein
MKVVNSTFLAFEWGIRDFQNEFTPVPMETYQPELNTINAVKAVSMSRLCFCGYGLKTASKTGLKHLQAGITLLASAAAQPEPFYDVFRLYSYRGIYNAAFLGDADNFRLVSNYAGAQSNYGNDLFAASKFREAAAAYKRALMLPYRGSRNGMQANLNGALKRGSLFP